MQRFNEFISNLKTLVSFKSVYSKPNKSMPFGEENYKALNFFLSLASAFGFETINYDNYIGEVRFGNGEEVGIIGHLDVVPTGIGWNSDPFTLTEKDGVFFARGIVDDKAAPLLCLYALKELKESGTVPNKTFRLFVGCDEESGWRDIEYLSKKTTIPEYGFSPDGNFPLSYAEKGITEVEFSIPRLKNFSVLSGGTALNAVCDYATAVASEKVIDKELLEKYGLKLKDRNVIESFGKAAHGSTPHLGKNAILPLLKYISEFGEDVSPLIKLFFDGGIIPNYDNEQGATTLSPNLLKEEGDKIYLTCDCRIPAPLTTEKLTPFFDGLSLSYRTHVRHKPMMAEKEGWLVSSLLSAYDYISGESSKPFSMGGSTFARAFKKGCAFGPEFNGKNYNIHDSNENVSKEDLLLWYEIYKTAIFNLAK